VHRLAGPARDAVGAPGSTIGINNGEATGQTIPHVHVHIVPRHAGDGAGSVHTLFKAGPRRDVAEVGAAIRKALTA
jgi:histidine triad (HIT) family protein